MNKNKSFASRLFIIVLCAALIAFSIPLLGVAIFARQDSDPVVIVLDPGHGGSDVGATCSAAGLYEADVNLAIALACYEELLRYDGVEVYLTHTGLDYGSGKLSLEERVDLAYEVDADILISLHCNDSSNLYANGSEVYVSHSTYKKEYNQQSTQLAICILRRFKELGLNIRGVKTRLSDGSRMYSHPDGSREVGDYYAVIGDTIGKYDIPGILVEHAFISGDSDVLGDPEAVRRLGIADATAIAEFYGLKLADKAAQSAYQIEEVVVATDEDIVAAGLVENAIISLPTELEQMDLYTLRSVMHRYEELSPGGRSCIADEDVDFIYHSIIETDYRTHPVRIVAKEEATITVNRIEAIITDIAIATGSLAPTNVAQLKAELETYTDTELISSWQLSSDGYRIEVYDSEGAPMDIGETVTTGCIVRLMSGDEIVDELYTVAIGDIDGDGRVDSFDQLLLDGYLYGTPVSDADVQPEESSTQLSHAQREAADVNGDGRIDEDDIAALAKMIIELN